MSGRRATRGVLLAWCWMTVCGSACASTCGPTCGSAFALRNEHPTGVETAANEHNQDSATTPDKGWENEKSQVRQVAGDAWRRGLPFHLPLHLPFGLPFHLPMTEHSGSTELAANTQNPASATAPDKGANHKVAKGTPAGECDTESVREKAAASGSLRACGSPVRVISSTIHETLRRRRP